MSVLDLQWKTLLCMVAGAAVVGCGGEDCSNVS
jgi:hypothetical protein